MKKTLLCLSALFCLLPAAAVEWQTDWAAAKAQAKAEKKLILVDFTGSDWCGWCIRLRKEILDTPAFDAYAQDKFVCMEVDMPRTHPLPPKLREQNGSLCEEYGVRVFPTLLVTDPNGEVVGGFLGGRDSYDKVKEQLDLAVKSGKALRKSKKLKGEERAKKLFQVWVSVPQELRGHSQAMKEEIIRLDQNHVTGMDEELKAEEQKKAFDEEARLSKDSADLLRVTHKYYAIAMPQNKLEIARLRSTLMYYASETVEDVLKARDAVKEVMDMDPSITEETRRSILESYNDPEACLEEIRKTVKK